MEIGSILLILALLVLVVLFVGRPLFEKKEYSGSHLVETQAEEADHERSSLLAERDRVLNALQELDFDYSLGKIPEEDYPEQRKILVETGAGVLRRLDEIQAQSPNVDAEARLEAAVAARRSDAARLQPAGVNGGRKSAVAINAADDDLEKILADRRRVRREKSAGFCPQCGATMQKSDRFCPKCGAKIA